MYTLVLPAKDIPDDTSVRKVTGQTFYVLKRKLKVYYAKDLKELLETTPADESAIKGIAIEGVVYLVSEDRINGYPETTKFAIDFKCVSDLMEFCDYYLRSHK